MSRILMAVGDVSGDKYAADFVRELRKLDGNLHFRGLGGVELEKAGMELVVNQRNLAVGGVVELVPHLDRIVSSWRRMVSELRSQTPDLLVLVDSSGFNLPFARRAHRARIPILYYISPQVWASRRGRVRKLARCVDRMAVIFPFEAALYEGSGLAVEFVGHPLVERLEEATAGLNRDQIRRSLGIDHGDRVVALLPGSRKTELRHCLGLHLDVAKVLHARDSRIRFLLPVAPSIDRDVVEARIAERNLPEMLRLHLTDGRTPEALIASDVVVAKPGTATLEATLLGRPLVIAVRINPISAALYRRILNLEFLGMPNLISGHQVVPEFLQDDADPDKIATAVLERLDGPIRERQLAALAEVRTRLGNGGAARRVAAIAQEMLIAGAGA